MTVLDIGIIGGADGPTRIYVTGSPLAAAAEILALAAAVFAVALIVRAVMRKRKI